MKRRNRYTFTDPTSLTVVDTSTVTDPLIVNQYRHLQLIKAMIERACGYAWRETAFIKDSPSHYNGSALDLAPLISSESIPYYSFSKRSDPILHKRPVLRRKLRRVKNQFPSSFPFDVGVFIETDHLHVQLFRRTDSRTTASYRLYSWGRPVDFYEDSANRQRLDDFPATTRGMRRLLANKFRLVGI